MKKILCVISIGCLIASCGVGGGGGGGGGSDANHEGDVSVDLERDNLDSGDLSRVNVEVRNLNPDGAILKFRSSRSLRYVKNSAIRFPRRDEERRITPYKDASTDNERYLVFFLYPDDAIDGDFISIQFDMKATTGDNDAFMEVDLDNNDQNVADSKEFSVDSPRFSALQRFDIFIAPDASQGTPTPVAGASPTPKK